MNTRFAGCFQLTSSKVGPAENVASGTFRKFLFCKSQVVPDNCTSIDFFQVYSQELDRRYTDTAGRRWHLGEKNDRSDCLVRYFF